MCSYTIGIDYVEHGAAALVLQRCGCFRPNLSSEDKSKPCTPGVVDTFCLRTNKAKVGVGTEQEKKLPANVFHPVKDRFFLLWCYKWVKSVIFTQKCFAPYQELHKVRDVWSHFRGRYSLCSMQWFTCCTALLFVISLLLLILQTNDVSLIIRDQAQCKNLPPSKSWTFTDTETLRSPGFKPPIHSCALSQERERRAWTIAQIISARQSMNRKDTTSTSSTPNNQQVSLGRCL